MLMRKLTSHIRRARHPVVDLNAATRRALSRRTSCRVCRALRLHTRTHTLNSMSSTRLRSHRHPVVWDAVLKATIGVCMAKAIVVATNNANTHTALNLNTAGHLVRATRPQSTPLPAVAATYRQVTMISTVDGDVAAAVDGADATNSNSNIRRNSSSATWRLLLQLHVCSTLMHLWEHTCHNTNTLNTPSRMPNITLRPIPIITLMSTTLASRRVNLQI